MANKIETDEQLAIRIIKILCEKYAKKETLADEDCNACEASGGNYDDAYSIGVDDGEIFLAREILKLLSEIK